MNLIEKQILYNTVKEAQIKYEQEATQSLELSKILNETLEKLKIDMFHEKSVMKANSQRLCYKLKEQNLQNRLDFITVNKFNDHDLEILSGLIAKEVDFTIPVLDLFPGTGQFLPFSLAAEPLYIADKFLEVCDFASNTLNNEFYVNRRLRKYKVKSYNLRNLPQESFGLVYCFNEFFIADEDYILRWSSLVYNLLYSGGKFIFNFIPDDTDWSIAHNQFMEFSTIDYYFLMEELKKQGFLIVNYAINQTKSSYIVCQKPGNKIKRHKIAGSVANILTL